MGYRPGKNIEIDAAFGWFARGPAFADTRQASAFAARLEVTSTF